MQFTTVIKLLALATVATAVPAPDSKEIAASLIRRAEIKPVSCGPTEDQRAWPLESVEAAFDRLQRFGRMPAGQRPRAGTRTYPQQYGDNSATPNDPAVVDALDGIDGCHTGRAGFKFFEFPITAPPFGGRNNPQGSQGPDRVIAISKNIGQGETREYKYCLSITHRGGTGGSDPSFRPCRRG